MSTMTSVLRLGNLEVPVSVVLAPMAGVIDASEGTGPWIAHWEPGESKVESVHRTYR